MSKTYDMECVIITVHGGIAEVESKSDNVKVIIRDYDIEGNPDRTTKDPNGVECIEREY